MKRSYFLGLAQPIAWPFIATLPLCSALQAQTLPSNGLVTAGAAVISRPVATTVQVQQSSQRAIIHWSDFSIGAGNKVSFTGPNAAAATLNVVSGNAASVLAGSLEANGSVYLVNRNGIMVTPSGLVDTRSGFVASTLNIDEAGFLAGRLGFAGKGGAVLNQGTILSGSGGMVALLGGSVSNEGTIRAPLGKVALGAAASATLDLNGDGFLEVILPADATGIDGRPLVNNSGTIAADGGTVVLKASTVRDAVRNAIYMPGEIQARTVSGKNGAVVLGGGDGGTVTVAGSIDASATDAGQGGRIDVSGDAVALAGAKLAATGPDGGGVVRVGGAYQGGQAQTPGDPAAQLFAQRFGALPALATARTTTVDAASSIDVSATAPGGAGGSVIVWSRERTDMQGALAARGDLGGAAEVSSSKRLAGVALGRIDLGHRGSLLLDPENILIDAQAQPGAQVGDYDYSSNNDYVTHLLDSDVTAFLSTGNSLSLKASQDISWYDNNSLVTRPSASRAGGDLTLSAGRSVSLNGVFSTADGNWTIIANDLAAHGVVDAARGPGAAALDVSQAHFAGSNGDLSLTLASGAGNTNRSVAGIYIGSYFGNSLSARIAPDAAGDWETPRINLLGDIRVAGAVTLDGNLRSNTESGKRTIAGSSVAWVGEKTGAAIDGSGGIAFEEQGLTTRLGKLNFNDAVRLVLDSSKLAPLQRTYGDADPDASALVGSPLRVAAYSANAPVDDLGAIFAPGALALSGPGLRAAAGTQLMSLGLDRNPSLAGNLSGGYLIDTTPVNVGLTVTPRVLTSVTGSPSFVYGGSAAPVSIGNLVNGDQLQPVVSIDGLTGIRLVPDGASFGFGSTLQGAGAHPYTLTGVSGLAAANYVLDPQGQTGGVVTVAPRTLNYAVDSLTREYLGRANAYIGATLSGLLNVDLLRVVPVLNYDAGARIDVGSYTAAVIGLSGSAASNYRVAPTGNTDGTLTITPSHLSFSIAPTSEYGAPVKNLIQANGASYLTPTYVATSGGQPVVLGARPDAGKYDITITGFAGDKPGNFVFDPQSGTLTIERKVLTYTGTTFGVEYGSPINPALLPQLIGVLPGDTVSATPLVTAVGATVPSGAGTYGVGSYGVDLVSLVGASASNYFVRSDPANRSTMLVTPKPVSLGYPAVSVQYGTQYKIPQASLGGVLPGDNVQVTSSFQSGAVVTAATAPGAYDAVASGAMTGANSGNYTLISPTAPLRINVDPKQISYSITNVGPTVYGDALELSNRVVLDGIINGDSVSALPVVFDANRVPVARPGVGYHSLFAGPLSGAQAGYYALNQAPANAAGVTITPRELQASFIYPAAFVYGEPVQTNTVVLSPTLPGDTAHASVNYRLPDFTTVNSRTPVGDYFLSLNRATDNPNYVVSSTAKAELTIAPRPLTYATTGASVVYGDEPSLALATLTGGLLSGDKVFTGEVGVVSNGQSYGAGGNYLYTTNRLNVGSYPVQLFNLGGADARNYVLANDGNQQGALTVTPREINYTVSLQDHGKDVRNPSYTYGSLSPGALTGTVELNGLLAGDDRKPMPIQVNLPTSHAGFVAAGDYKIGPDSVGPIPNYIIRQGSPSSVIVFPAPLTVAPYASLGLPGLTEVTYGDTGMLSIQPGISGLLRGDDVHLASHYLTAGGVFDKLPDRLPVGQVIVTPTSITGQDIGNYSVLEQVSSFNVIPRPASVDIAPLRTEYGSPLPALDATIKGVLSGDQVNIAYAATVNPAHVMFNDVGSYDIDTTLSGAALSNYAFATKNPVLANGWTIAPRRVTISGDTSNLALTYGETTSRTLSITSGIQFGQPLQVTTKAKVGDARYDLNGVMLDAGAYSIVPELSGPYAKNYQIFANNIGGLPEAFGTLTVAKRQLGFSVPDTIEYGTFLTPVLNNMVAGQTIDGNFLVSDGYNPVNHTYAPLKSRDGYYDLGLHTIDFVSSNPAQLKNYELPRGADFKVGPKTLYANTNIYYGDTSVDKFGVLTTDGHLNPIPIEMPRLLGSDVTNQNFLLFISSAPNGYTRDNLGDISYINSGPLLEVGTYNLQASLQLKVDTTGGYSYVHSPYYRLVDNSVTLTVKPRPIYLPPTVTMQYGGFASTCTDGCDPYLPGAGFRPSQMPGDNVFVQLSQVPSNGGAARVFDRTTDIGSYQNVAATGLSGAGAQHYVLSTDATDAYHVLQVLPLYLNYEVSSGIMIGGVPFGTPGIPHLLGPNGMGPINGDQVTASVSRYYYGMKVQPDFPFVNGRFTYLVTGLTGKDAAKYRIYPQNAYSEDPTKPVFNSVGTLDVFDDTSFGLHGIGSPKLVLGEPKSTLIGSSNTSHGIDDILGQLNDALDDRTVSVTAGASTSTGHTNSLGAADMDSEASAGGSASASAGPLGANANAHASGEVSSTVTYGPLTTDVKGGANVGGEVSAGPVNADIGANAVLTASGSATASGGIGHGYTGTASLTGEASAGFDANAGAGYKNGSFHDTAEAAPVGSVSAGISGTASNHLGSVTAGAGITSGSVGAGITYGGGYSEGVVSVAIDASLGLGAIGGNVSFAFTLDLNDANEDFISGIGLGYVPDRGAKALAHADKFGDDHAARIQYLVQTDDWRKVGNTDPTNPAYLRALADVTTFEHAKEALLALQVKKLEYQKQMLYWLQRDPSVAVAISSAEDRAFLFYQQEQAISADMGTLGLGFAINDDSIGLVNL